MREQDHVPRSVGSQGRRMPGTGRTAAAGTPVRSGRGERRPAARRRSAAALSWCSRRAARRPRSASATAFRHLAGPVHGRAVTAAVAAHPRPSRFSIAAIPSSGSCLASGPERSSPRPSGRGAARAAARHGESRVVAAAPVQQQVDPTLREHERSRLKHRAQDALAGRLVRGGHIVGDAWLGRVGHPALQCANGKVRGGQVRRGSRAPPGRSRTRRR